MARRPQRGIIAVVTLTLAGCASFPRNPVLHQVDLAKGYRFQNLSVGNEKNTDENFVILAFSGGGTRAAALAYGVLEYLRDTKIEDNRKTLLDEVDVISSVSGGSFTAAYYGLFGRQKFFSDFKSAVLERKIERDLILRILAPWNWPRLLSPWFGRSDLADEYYDSHIFEGQTYRAMPRQRPFIILNATDISLGAQFSFVQDDFDRLCSDLDGVPVSRGVTASSAFPVAFTPLTVQNYAKSECHYVDPQWVSEALQDFQANPPRYYRALTWQSYSNAKERPYIHVSDGGLADNIGLRGPEVAIASNDSPWSLFNMVNNRQVKRIVVIVVDAKPADPTTLDRCARPPGIYSVLNAAATNPMENYSSDTVELLRRDLADWNIAASDFDKRRAAMRDKCEKLATGSCPRGASTCKAERQRKCEATFVPAESDRPPSPQLYEVHVQFDALGQDSPERKDLEAIPTALQLSEQDVHKLTDAAKRLLHEDRQFKQLVIDLRGELPPP